jgi:hypothetical protein
VAQFTATGPLFPFLSHSGCQAGPACQLRPPPHAPSSVLITAMPWWTLAVSRSSRLPPSFILAFKEQWSPALPLCLNPPLPLPLFLGFELKPPPAAALSLPLMANWPSRRFPFPFPAL